MKNLIKKNKAVSLVVLTLATLGFTNSYFTQDKIEERNRYCSMVEALARKQPTRRTTPRMATL